MPWFLFVLFLCLPFSTSSLSEGRLEKKKLPSATIVGAVYCDTCYQQDSSKNSHFISGATVAVECKSDGNSEPSFREEVKTDENGEFIVHLPLSISKHVKRIKACTVHLISSNQPYCSVASTANSSALQLQSRKQGEHIFSAGFFSFKPQNQPKLCNPKPITQQFKQLNSVKTFHLPSNKPPLPQVNQGLSTVSLSRVQSKGKIYTDSANKVHQSNRNGPFTKQSFPPNLLQPTLPVPNPLLPPPLIPNPLQPPPLISNPLQPPPLIPNPLQPPSTPLIPLPPLPGLTPPPPPPFLPFPYPQFPLPPISNPLLPPPLIPIPLQPPPRIPNPLQPPSIPLIPLPPLPGLTAPPPPFLPFPYPQFPLPPFPRFPGVPPARPGNENLP